MSQDELFINGDLLRLRREARGWVLNDMATRACMSVKQIRQLEEGGISAFYSIAVKATAAKKVAALLGISADEVFARDFSSVVEAESALVDVDSPEPSVVAESEVPASVVTQQTPVVSVVEVQSDVLGHKAPSESVSDGGQAKSKTSLLTIAVLFVLALAAAAYLQPKEDIAVEPAPPVQVLPTDATDPASAASASDVGASSAADLAVSPASMSAVVASAGTPRLAASNASAPVVVRSASVTAAPAASVASKAP